MQFDTLSSTLLSATTLAGLQPNVSSTVAARCRRNPPAYVAGSTRAEAHIDVSASCVSLSPAGAGDPSSSDSDATAIGLHGSGSPGHGPAGEHHSLAPSQGDDDDVPQAPAPTDPALRTQRSAMLRGVDTALQAATIAAIDTLHVLSSAITAPSQATTARSNQSTNGGPCPLATLPSESLAPSELSQAAEAVAAASSSPEMHARGAEGDAEPGAGGGSGCGKHHRKGPGSWTAIVGHIVTAPVRHLLLPPVRLLARSLVGPLGWMAAS